MTSRNGFDFIRKLPGWITGIIAFVTAIVGFIKLWQGDTGLVTIVLLFVGVVGGLGGCAYVVFKRTPSSVVGGGLSWQYPRWRRWALAGLVIILLLAVSGLGYHLYLQYRPPDKVIILVADFDGPKPEHYGVTVGVLNNLRQALKPLATEEHGARKVEILHGPRRASFRMTEGEEAAASRRTP